MDTVGCNAVPFVVAKAALPFTVRVWTVDVETDRGPFEVSAGLVSDRLDDRLGTVTSSVVADGSDVCMGTVIGSGSPGATKVGFTACTSPGPVASAADRASSRASVTRWLVRAPPEVTTSPGLAVRGPDDGVEMAPSVEVGIEDAGTKGRRAGGFAVAGPGVTGEAAAEPGDVDPDGLDAEVFDVSEVDEFVSGVAHATPWPAAAAAPTPSATASPPTRPI
jgi:hypothetical protein